MPKNIRKMEFNSARSCCYQYTVVLLDRSKSCYCKILLFSVRRAFARAGQSPSELKRLNAPFEAILIGKWPLINNWRLLAC